MKTTMKHRFFNSPITRIILGLLLSFATFIIAQQLVRKLLDLTPIDKNYINLIKGIIASSLVVLVYVIFYGKVEKREINELSRKRSFKNIIVGVSIGTALQCLTLIVVCFFGDFQTVSVNPISFLITPFAVALSVAIFEEILLRGIIFRITEEKLGSKIALMLSAIIFGAVHLTNPNSSVISSICTGLVGFVFGASYIYTRSLWLPIAIHFSWNFVQSGIFGSITSGNEKTSSLFNTNISGSELIVGGEFGPEGTIQATLLWLIVAVVFAVLITKQNRLIQPFRKSKNLARTID